MTVKKDNIKICLISSHGGHLHELTQATIGVAGEKYWITFRTKHTEKLLKNVKHYFIIDPHVTKWKYLINTWQSFNHLLKERPQVIISTGAGIAIPTIMLGKFLFGCKIVFVESAAAVIDPTATGKFVYKWSNLFLIQWPGLKEYFPKAVYIGLL